MSEIRRESAQRFTPVKPSRATTTTKPKAPMLRHNGWPRWVLVTLVVPGRPDSSCRPTTPNYGYDWPVTRTGSLVPGATLARIYYTQMTERGASHLKACCVVAGYLALRLHVAMLRGTPTRSATPTARLSPGQARQIIAANWTVPDDIRNCRRSRKKTSGKAPQQAARPGRRGGPPAPGSPPPRGPVNPPPDQLTQPRRPPPRGQAAIPACSYAAQPYIRHMTRRNPP